MTDSKASDIARIEADLIWAEKNFQAYFPESTGKSPAQTITTDNSGPTIANKYARLMEEYERAREASRSAQNADALNNKYKLFPGTSQSIISSKALTAKKPFRLEPPTRTPLHDFAEQICGEAHAILNGSAAFATAAASSSLTNLPRIFLSQAVLGAFLTGCGPTQAESHSGPDGFWFIPGMRDGPVGGVLMHQLILSTHLSLMLVVDKDVQDWQARLVFDPNNPDTIFGIVDNNFI